MNKIRTVNGRKALKNWLRLHNHHFTPPVLTAQFTFSGAEIWVILRLLGVVASGMPIPAELSSEQAAVQRAETALLNRGILLSNTTTPMTIAPTVRAVVQTTTSPETVLMATISDTVQSGKLERTVCCSFTAQETVINWVDEQQIHHFEAFAPTNRSTCLLSHLHQICNWNFGEAAITDAPPTTAEFEQEVKQMRQLVLIMAVTGVTEPQQETVALSWFVGKDHAWLIENRESAQETVQPVTDRSQIDLAILELVEKVLPTIE